MASGEYLCARTNTLEGPRDAFLDQPGQGGSVGVFVDGAGQALTGGREDAPGVDPAPGQPADMLARFDRRSRAE